MKIRISSNTDVVTHDLDGLARRCKDLRPAQRLFGAYMVESSIPANFRSGGRPQPWAGIQRPGRIMEDTRRLLNSISYEISGDVVRIGTNAEYGPQRHFGGIIKAKDKLLAIPASQAKRKSRPKYFGDELRWAPATKTGPKGHLRGRLVQTIGKGRRRRTVTRFWLYDQVEQPARPFLLVHPEDVARAHRIVFDHIRGGG